MEQDLVISYEDLVAQGWTFIGNFGYSLIMGKDNQRILYDEEYQIIRLVYDV